jgi:hypothetical protein
MVPCRHRWVRLGLRAAVALLTGMGVCLAPAASAQLGQNGGVTGESTQFGEVAAPRAGETCIVCRKSVGHIDRVYTVDGQRLPVHRVSCEALLKQAPGRYLASLKPRGAFLGAEPATGSAASWNWVLVAGYVLLGLAFGGWCSYRALNHGLSPIRWFFIGFFLNLLGFAILLARPRGERVRAPGGVPPGLAKFAATHSPRPCSACGKLNHPSAAACAGCRGKLQPAMASEVVKAGVRAG